MADVEVEDTGIIFKKRGPKKSTIRKRAATPPGESSSEYSSEDESGVRVKRRKKTGGIVLGTSTNGNHDSDLSKSSKYAADRSATIEATNDATKQSNWYEDPSQLSAKELLGSSRNKSSAPIPSVSYDTSALNKKREAEEAARTQKGPVKAATNIRTITVTDYSPDVCKDYKQTGHCGFGDGCKFLHAREDYKQGWQLDKEWETVAKGKKNLGGTVTSSRTKADGDEDDDDEESLLEGIPFACIICKEGYKNPIVTRCGHYFCEACALKRFRKTPSCAHCAAGTGGVFNGAKNLKKLLERKKEREARMKQKARENGEEVSEDEEDDEAE